MRLTTYWPLSPTHYRKQLWLPRKQGPPRGSLHYQYLSMDLLSTKGHFVMRSAYGMAGDHPFYHHSVFVTSVSQWSMHWAAHLVDFPQYATTKWETSLPISWAMSATTSDLNQPYNPSPVSGYTTALPILRMELVSTSRHRDSGRTTDNVHSLILGFLIPSHIPIVLSPSPPATEDMSKKRRGPTISASEKWNMDAFHLLLSQHLGVWDPQPMWCTRS